MRIAILLPLVVACATDSAAPPVTHESQDPWVYLALPALQDAQCFECHAAENELGFLAGEDKDAVRHTLLESGIVDPDNILHSRLLTKGYHEGNPLTEEQAHAITSWLATE
jgi:hypothetical protein